MTVEQARAILGSAYDVIDDEKILKIIKLFESISLILIEKETTGY
ncbi:MAG: hypothetical protein WCO66_03045 [Candidatus Absconditabacteria bacterium]